MNTTNSILILFIILTGHINYSLSKGIFINMTINLLSFSFYIESAINFKL